MKHWALLVSSLFVSASVQAATPVDVLQTTNQRIATGDYLGDINLPKDKDLISREQMSRSIERSIARAEKIPFKDGTFILVNIPAYEMQVWQDGKMVLSSPVIVGKKSTPTPVMNTSLYAVKYNPDWTVPVSLNNSYLAKISKGGGSRLAGQNIVGVTSSGKQVPANQITPNMFRSSGMHFYQKSGSNNALGEIKFELRNDQMIYFHDTNERQFFALDERAKSHGCVRVKNFEQLASWVQGISIDDVRKNISRGKTYITPVREIPVYITYLTAWVDSSNKLSFYSDIYNMD